MKIVEAVDELAPAERAAAIGTFDGVHAGHRAVIEAALATGLRTMVVTFEPHPRQALGNRVELLTTLARRLELLAELGVDDALVLGFTLEFARTTPEEFAERILRASGVRALAAGPGFRFGHRRAGDLELLERLGFEVARVARLEDVSSTRVRQLVADGDVEAAAPLLLRPVEVEGTVVAGDARGGTLGFPTANLRVPAELVVPRNGIYAGATRGHRAAVSIGTNPHYGGLERRVEAFLLDFDGDLYGERLTVELWERLRDEAAFPTERELVEQIHLDVERTRTARRPV